ncbi:hypothetical protein IF650_06520 [Cellulosimicrobium terreum]|nr:hypothetical protein [Cellulosimicrobium terreum]
MASLDRAREAKALLREEIGGTQGVNGVGLTRAGRADAVDDWVLRVNVASADVSVPARVDGVEVEVRVVGPVVAARSSS